MLPRRDEFGYIRSLVYRIFSILVSYPYDEDIDKIIERIDLLDNLLETLKRYNYNDYKEDIKKLKQYFNEEISRLGRDLFQAEYTSIFDLGMPQPPCPPYEYIYKTIKEETESPVYQEAIHLNRLENLYRKYGVKADWRIERPDHITVELEFLSHLCLIHAELMKKGEEIKEIINDEETLIKQNIIPLINHLIKCIKKTRKLKPYQKLYKIMSRFLEEDLDHLIS